ncbi:hypothetical protein MSG28_015532 [Choristoneura fumiferana]|uniref:Uncharacterized protein n=1 Tax=Choristoneura fumiferana TaxID=7141 RepID=A0ACC0KBA8_CHOFU|nr:hypothetical protein MSG28_015532 [Choristoneura fumiferana]
MSNYFHIGNQYQQILIHELIIRPLPHPLCAQLPKPYRSATRNLRTQIQVLFVRFAAHLTGKLVRDEIDAAGFTCRAVNKWDLPGLRKSEIKWRKGNILKPQNISICAMQVIKIATHTCILLVRPSVFSSVALVCFAILDSPPVGVDKRYMCLYRHSRSLYIKHPVGSPQVTHCAHTARQTVEQLPLISTGTMKTFPECDPRAPINCGRQNHFSELVTITHYFFIVELSKYTRRLTPTSCFADYIKTYTKSAGCRRSCMTSAMCSEYCGVDTTATKRVFYPTICGKVSGEENAGGLRGNVGRSTGSLVVLALDETSLHRICFVQRPRMRVKSPQQCRPEPGAVPTMDLVAEMPVVAFPGAAGQGTTGVHLTDRVVANHDNMVTAGLADWYGVYLILVLLVNQCSLYFRNTFITSEGCPKSDLLNGKSTTHHHHHQPTAVHCGHRPLHGAPQHFVFSPSHPSAAAILLTSSVTVLRTPYTTFPVVVSIRGLVCSTVHRSCDKRDQPNATSTN